MDDLNSLDAMTREGIDACRPESADHQLPELAEVFDRVQNQPAAARQFDRVQRIDAVLRTMIQGVTIPEGLADRLLERVQAECPELPAAKRAATAGRRRNAWWQIGLAAGLLIAASAALAWKWLPAPPANVVTLAEAWSQDLGDAWRPMATAPKALVIPVRLAVAPRGWQPTSNLLGYKAAAYDFSRPGRRAVLFVVQVAPEGELPANPPDSPQYSAGGRLLAAWVTGNRMCLLIVEGDDRDYRDLIRPRMGPIAEDLKPERRMLELAFVRCQLPATC
jgi:hypothetical protein